MCVGERRAAVFSVHVCIYLPARCSRAQSPEREGREEVRLYRYRRWIYNGERGSERREIYRCIGSGIVVVLIFSRANAVLLYIYRRSLDCPLARLLDSTLFPRALGPAPKCRLEKSELYA